ncbi:uncharacterized protein LOC124934891 [Impatiens glandulifera]|uniref:uncharacterized protein LOC124934891 n=1 Tax=Impatiens glandulifera TaxID=253017 RepID=UPI001FB12307|nr:uncharacterized protein LOC124934891 [Impatiens glandulifera]
MATVKTDSVVSSDKGEIPTTTDVEKKIRRAEMFCVSIQLSEQEKRNTRAERFYANGRHILSAGQDRAFRLFSVIQDQQSRELSQRNISRIAKKLKMKVGFDFFFLSLLKSMIMVIAFSLICFLIIQLGLHLIFSFFISNQLISFICFVSDYFGGPLKLIIFDLSTMGVLFHVWYCFNHIRISEELRGSEEEDKSRKVLQNLFLFSLAFDFVLEICCSLMFGTFVPVADVKKKARLEKLAVAPNTTTTTTTTTVEDEKRKARAIRYLK